MADISKFDWIHSAAIAPGENARLQQAIASVREGSRFAPYSANPAMDNALKRLVLQAFSPETLEALEHYRRGESLLLILKNLPVVPELGPVAKTLPDGAEKLPGVPRRGGLHRHELFPGAARKTQNLFTQEAVALAIGSLLGESFGGFDHIYPTQKNRTENHPQSSLIKLGWHTDLSSSGFAPKHNMLSVVRAGEKPYSLFARAADVVGKLEGEDKKLLMSESFHSIEDKRKARFAVLTKQGDEWWFRLNSFKLEARTPEAARALRRLISLISLPENHVSFPTDTGDMLIADGRQLAHARGSFRMHETPSEQRYVIGLLREENIGPAGPQMLF